ncbi:Cytochrome P450 52A12 [Pseudocercospora fuligena]|uniref:Cytochrome P450 52A12 n=1 Tax=Pseudocercospora fuligena TaxID=685502 RepID=A0A8H6VTD5_9PEZI|nr:Cytochrome P450 52A12 [Pseudocercospora fuligena]
MHNYILIPLVGVAVLGLYKILNIIVTRFQNASRARQLGCQDPPMFPNCGFLGLKHVKLLQAADEKNMFPDFMEERSNIMSKETGRVCSTFTSYLLGQTIYFTSDPENIKAMLATQFPDFDLGPIRHAIMGEVLGEGIFVQDGKPWEHSRAMLRPNFVRDQISDLDMEERHVQNLFAALPPQQDGWTAFTNLQELFFRLTMDASTELLFGRSVDSQISENPHATKNKSAAKTHDEAAFAINFDQAQLHMAKKFRLVNFHWMHNPKEYQVNNKVVNDFVRYYVNLALKQSNSEKQAEEGHGKEKFVFLEALAKQTRDPDELRGQLLNILLAGRDTTASLLSWLFHQLLRNPHVFEKLRSTVIENFGTYDSPKDITFSTLKGCQYLQYTLNEVLRLQTIVPGNGRTANKPTTLPRGGGPDGKSPVFIPAGAQVDYSVHVMHRRKDIWGEDALEFKPERFIGRRPGWEFLPFNGGPRICIGQQFALTEASYVVVRLLQKFDRIEAAPGELEGPVTTDLGLTSCPKRPVTLRLRVAKD